MSKEVQKKYAQGMAEIIELMQAKGYTPQDTQGVCLSLAATIALNYLHVPLESIQRAMDMFGEACGVNLAYHGAIANPSHAAEDKGMH